LTGKVRKIVIPTEFGKIIDLAPMNSEARSIWILLGSNGDIFRFDADTAEGTRLASITIPDEGGGQTRFRDSARKLRLHSSFGGDYAAVVCDYGRYGAVVDLNAGKVTMRLDGGDYCNETVPFSFAFLNRGRQTIAVHRTAWNRLDLSDASSGELLSIRNPTSYQNGEPRPEHYLDYFHGALYVSPNGTRIVDDGWVWHPVGVPTVWDLNLWISANPWESDDGPTRKEICARDSYWDRGVAWLNERIAAIGGIGDDDSEMVEGARIFDVTSEGPAGSRWRSDWSWAKEITAFPGPAGKFFSDGRSLYSSDKIGLSKWDTETGARLGCTDGFHPIHIHTGVGELAELADDALAIYHMTG